MAKTLNDIVSEVPPSDLAADSAGSLKKLKEKLEAARTAHENASETEKENKKTELEAAKKAYDDKRKSVLDLIQNKINEEAEKDNLALYSKEVAERRNKRKASNIQDEITEVQGQIDVFSLEIASIDKEIEEKRKSFVPATKAIA